MTPGRNGSCVHGPAEHPDHAETRSRLVAEGRQPDPSAESLATQLITSGLRPQLGLPVNRRRLAGYGQRFCGPRSG